MVDLLGREKAAAAETLVLNRGYSVRRAGDAREEHLTPMMLEIYRRFGLRADVGAGPAPISEPLIILDIELLVTPQHLLPLRLSHPPRMGEAVDHKMIDAQHFRDGVHHIGIEAIDRCSDDHDRGDAYDDADQGQKGPEFVRKDRLQRKSAGVVTKKDEALHISVMLLPRVVGFFEKYAGERLRTSRRLPEVQAQVIDMGYRSTEKMTS